MDLSQGLDEPGGALESELRRGGVDVVFVESPSNPLLEVLDLRSVAKLAHAHGARLVVDGTAMTPWLQRPLELGADAVVHSATKGLSGHGDVTAGVVATCDGALLADLAARRNAEGTALAPFEAWLLARGLKTLGVRVEAAQRSARWLAEELAAQPWVRRWPTPAVPAAPALPFTGPRRQAAAS